jgi:hypothetical protein
MYRILIAVSLLSLAGCGSASGPTQPLSPAAATRDDINPPPDAVPDPSCRSGWSVANGRCW